MRSSSPASSFFTGGSFGSFGSFGYFGSVGSFGSFGSFSSTVSSMVRDCANAAIFIVHPAAMPLLLLRQTLGIVAAVGTFQCVLNVSSMCPPMCRYSGGT